MNNQKKLSKSEIQKKLKGFKRLKNIKELKIGMHIRYFNKTKTKVDFRLGGILTFIDKDEQFLGCTNMVDKNKKWWIQLNKSGVKCIIFYKNLVEQRQNDKKMINKVKHLLKYLDGNINFLSDALNVLGGIKNPDQIDANLDILYSKYNGKISNVFKELEITQNKLKKLKQNNNLINVKL